MNAVASWMLWELASTTLLVAVLGVSAWLVLRLARIGSPVLHRACCVAVLLAGWTFVRWPVEVAWYEAPEAPVTDPAAVPVVAAQSFSPPIDPALLSPPPEFGAPMSLPPQISTAPPPVESPLSTVPASVVTATPDALPANRQLSWQQLAIGVWLVGIVTIVSAWIVGYLRFLQKLPGDVGPAVGPVAEWAAEFAAVCAEQGGAGDVTLRVTESAGPLVCRIPRGAMLLVPRSLWIALAPHERRAILRHELAHYRRGDLWKSLAVRVLALPHWFNPVAWLAVRRFDDAAEWACDRAAMGEEPTTYAAMLLRLGELASTPTRFGSAMSGRPLNARIRRLLTLSVAEDSAMKKATLISLLILVLPLALVRVTLVAQEPEEDPFTDPPQAANLAAPLEESPPLEEPSAAEPPAASQSPPDEAGGEPPRAAPPESPVRIAQRKMLEMAAKTYTVNWESAKAGQAVFDLDEAIRWSNLWLSAELALAKSRAEQLAAARAHLERIKVVEAAVRSLHERGSKGGETIKLSAANYHLADAERRLAEIEAMPEPAAQAVPAQADRKMVETAKRAFEATRAAYESGQTTLDRLIGWSFKWLAAELAVAKSREEQLAAAQANVARIKKLHTGIAALYAAGSHGGQAQLMETANYYLADAERRLAEIEVALPKSADTDQRPASTADKLKLVVPVNGSQAFLNGTTFALDDPALIRALRKTLADRGSSELMTAMMIAGIRVNHDDGPAVGPRPEVAPEIIALMDHPQKLIREYAAQVLLGMRSKIGPALEEATRSPNAEIAEKARTLLSQVEPVPVNVTPNFPTPAPPQPAPYPQAPSSAAPQPTVSPYASKPTASPYLNVLGQSKVLVYEGGNFEHWAGQLQSDLSPVVRKEAMQAMGEFAAHGDGKRAAKVIFETMGGYSVWTIDDSPEGQLKEEAIKAALKVPASELLPVIRSALASDSVNQRLFALRAVPFYSDKQDVVPLLVAASRDANSQVAALARGNLSVVDHDNPAVVDWLRSTLRSNKSDDIENALVYMRGWRTGPAYGQQMGATVGPYLEVVPEAAALLDHQDEQIRTLANDTFTDIGTPVLDPLESILSSGNGTDAVRWLYDKISAKGGTPLRTRP